MLLFSFSELLIKHNRYYITIITKQYISYNNNIIVLDSANLYHIKCIPAFYYIKKPVNLEFTGFKRIII